MSLLWMALCGIAGMAGCTRPQERNSPPTVDSVADVVTTTPLGPNSIALLRGIVLDTGGFPIESAFVWVQHLHPPDALYNVPGLTTGDGQFTTVVQNFGSLPPDAMRREVLVRVAVPVRLFGPKMHDERVQLLFVPDGTQPPPTSITVKVATQRR